MLEQPEPISSPISPAPRLFPPGPPPILTEGNDIRINPRRRRSTLIEQLCEKSNSWKDQSFGIEQLAELREKFEGIISRGEGELGEDEFVEVLGPIMRGKVTTKELRKLFVRVDANANGRVDWDEFSTFILLSGEHRQREALINACYSRKADVSRAYSQRNPDHHTSPTTVLLCHPRNGKYYTASKDGMIKSWHGGTQMLDQTLLSSTSWITDAVFMKNATRLAVCSMDKVVSVFDISGTSGQGARLWRAFVGKLHGWGKEERHVREGVDMGETTSTKKIFDARAVSQFKTLGAYQKEVHRMLNHCSKDSHTLELTVLQDLQDCPMSIAAWGNLLCIGLKNGALQVYDPFTTSLTHSEVVPCEATFKLHSSPISKVKSSKYMDGVITAGWDNTIRIVSLERGKVTRVLGENTCTRSIFSLDWSEDNRLLASAGAERNIRLWNPYINRPVYKLEGHHHPLLTICFNTKYDQLLSLGVDKCVKVWDLRTMKCLQTIPHDDPLFSKEDAVTTLAYDPYRGALVCGSQKPLVFPLKSTLPFQENANTTARDDMPNHPQSHAHTAGITAIRSNVFFDQIITADTEKLIVWDIVTGAKLNVFYPTKGDAEAEQEGTVPLSTESIISVDFDATGRRVIIGASERVYVINASNGQLLKEMVLKDPSGNRIRNTINKEIIQAIYLSENNRVGKHVCAAAGDCVVLWEDVNTDSSCQTVRVHQSLNIVDNVTTRPDFQPDPSSRDFKGSLTCLCKMPRSLVAVGTDFDVVILYSYLRNEVFNRLIGSPKIGVPVDYLHFSPTHDCLVITSDIHIQFWSFSGKCFLFSIKQRSLFSNIAHQLRSAKPVEKNKELDDLAPPNTSGSTKVGWRVFHAAEFVDEKRWVVTGDDCGKICVWNIAEKILKRSPLAGSTLEEPTLGNQSASVKRISSFQAHCGAVSIVQTMVIRNEYFIISSGVDSMTNVHTLYGVFVGVLGQDLPWNLAMWVLRGQGDPSKISHFRNVGFAQDDKEEKDKPSSRDGVRVQRKPTLIQDSTNPQRKPTLMQDGQSQPRQASPLVAPSGAFSPASRASRAGAPPGPKDKKPEKADFVVTLHQIVSPPADRRLSSRVRRAIISGALKNYEEPENASLPIQHGRRRLKSSPKRKEIVQPDEESCVDTNFPPPPVKLVVHELSDTSAYRRDNQMVSPPHSAKTARSRPVTMSAQIRARGLPLERLSELGESVVGCGGKAYGVFEESREVIVRTQEQQQLLQQQQQQQQYQSSAKRYTQAIHGIDANKPQETVVDPKMLLSAYTPTPHSIEFATVSTMPSYLVELQEEVEETKEAMTPVEVEVEVQQNTPKAGSCDSRRGSSLSYASEVSYQHRQSLAMEEEEEEDEGDDVMPSGTEALRDLQRIKSNKQKQDNWALRATSNLNCPLPASIRHPKELFNSHHHKIE